METETTKPDFETALSAYLAEVQEASHKHFDASGYTVGRSWVEIERGKRYVRVILASPGPARSAYAFVDTTDGNIYKPAGWKGPEKNFPRGNVYDRAARTKWIGPYGVLCVR